MLVEQGPMHRNIIIVGVVKNTFYMQYVNICNIQLINHLKTTSPI
jgi:hypothetical protein